jgi:hypothetical protein
MDQLRVLVHALSTFIQTLHCLYFLVSCISGSLFPALFLVDRGAEIKVASTIVLWCIVTPSSQECLDSLKDLLFQTMLLKQVAEDQDWILTGI